MSSVRYWKCEQARGSEIYPQSREFDNSVPKSRVGLYNLITDGFMLTIVDEVQGTTQDVAIHKCRQAAEIVQYTVCCFYI